MSIKREHSPSNRAWTLIGDKGPTAERTGSIRWSVSDDQSAKLRELATGKRVLEIGTGTGFSAEAMAETAMSVATFDVDDEVKRLVWPGLPKNVSAFDRREAPLSEAGPGFDMIFIDGLHDHRGVIADITEAHPLMVPDATWVFHDWHMGGVRSAVSGGPVKFEVLEVHSDEGPTTMAICKVAR